MKKLLPIICLFFVLGCTGNVKKQSASNAAPVKIDSNTTMVLPVNTATIVYPKEVYHIKVEFFGSDSRYCYYCIKFTNDDFITEYTLNYVSDLTTDHAAVYISTDLYTSQQEAISVAKKYKTYQQCVAHNEKMELRRQKLIEHYNATLPKKKEKEYQPKCDQKSEIIVQ